SKTSCEEPGARARPGWLGGRPGRPSSRQQAGGHHPFPGSEGRRRPVRDALERLGDPRERTADAHAEEAHPGDGDGRDQEQQHTVFHERSPCFRQEEGFDEGNEPEQVSSLPPEAWAWRPQVEVTSPAGGSGPGPRVTPPLGRRALARPAGTARRNEPRV